MDEAFVPQAGLHGNLDGFRLRGITPGKASIPRQRAERADGPGIGIHATIDGWPKRFTM